jgi:hypothetical protein
MFEDSTNHHGLIKLNYTKVYLDILKEPEPDFSEGECAENILHWVWIFPKYNEMTYIHLTSCLSVLQNLKPKKIFLWYNNMPWGGNWTCCCNIIKETTVEIVYKNIIPAEQFMSKNISFGAHKSDLLRYIIMYQYGGIYLDFDVIVLKSFEPLLCYNITLAHESEDTLGNGIIVAKQNSKFIKIWIENYVEDFQPDKWDFNSVQTAMKLAKKYPELIHIEAKSMLHPSWENELQYLYQENLYYNWTRNYCIHIWTQVNLASQNPDVIKKLNSTYGQVMRYIWYGSSNII